MIVNLYLKLSKVQPFGRYLLFFILNKFFPFAFSIISKLLLLSFCYKIYIFKIAILKKKLYSQVKVIEAFKAKNINIEVLNLSVSTKTSKEAANAVGCSLSQIAKSIVFYEVDHKKLVQIFVSGPNRVDVDIFQKHTGLRIEKADANFVRESTGFAIGGVAPIGHINKPLYYLDETLTQFEDVWCAAGTPNSLFKIKTSDLLKVCEPKILQVC